MTQPVPPSTALAAAPPRARGRPRKTADERDDGNRRRELVNGAAKLFRAQGFAGTSTRDIATAVGMRSGSPFYHFENKEALLAAVMEEGMQRALRQILRRFLAGKGLQPGTRTLQKGAGPVRIMF